MAEATDAVLHHFLARAEIIDRPPHVEDILPGQALPCHHVAEELETLEVAAAKRRALTLAERQASGQITT